MTKLGRPSAYTDAIAEAICNRLSEGETLIAICRDEGMPSERTVRSWVRSNLNDFSPKYTQARELGYQRMADELLEISDDGSNDWMLRYDEDNEGWQANGEHLQRSRLRVDTRKWLLSKALPKLYGDRLTHSNDPENPLPSAGTAAADLLAVLSAIADRTKEPKE